MSLSVPFGHAIDGTPPSAEHVQKVFDDYCAAVSSGDLDGIVKLFAEDAEFMDPVGQEVAVGHDKIRAFFEPSAGLLELRVEGAVRIAGFYAAAAMRARAHGFGVETFYVDTLDALSFNEDGKITRFYAFWGPTNNPSPNHDW
ncbi:MAG: nuclear transport factor 2 family protein [Parvibaculales bacterium]